MSNITFQDKITVIPADWLNYLNTIGQAAQELGLDQPPVSGPPTSGTYGAGRFLRNNNVTVQGAAPNQYLVRGWRCILGGTPGTWVAISEPMAPSSGQLGSGSTGLPQSAPAPSTGDVATLYNVTVLAENLTGTGTFATWATLASSFVTNDSANGGGTGASTQDSTSGKTHIATFAGCTAGVYSIVIRYFLFTQQDQFIQIDSGSSVDTIFPTGSGWQTLTITGKTLAAGTHTITASSNSGFMNIHWIALQQTSSVVPVAAFTPAPAPATAGNTAYPFGARTDGAYPNGIKVSGVANATMDAALAGCYDKWKSARLIPAPSFVNPQGVTITTGYYVDSPNQISAPNAATGDPGIFSLTTSEAVGYGMVIVAFFAGHETNAQAIFNGLFQVARGFPASSMTATGGQYLMDYRVGRRPGPAGATLDFTSQGGGWNACDGDMDIARALLMAHRQWGSSGAINYYAEALNTINALKASNFSSTGIMWDSYHNVSRTSDYMAGHFMDFNKATQDSFWTSAITNSLAMLQSVINASSPTSKLPCEWIYDPMGVPVASPGRKIDGDYEGYYGPNAVRVAMRQACHYVFSGLTASHDIASNIVTTIKTKAGNSATATSWMYDLSANPYQGNLYYEPTQDACTMAGGCVDVAHQAWVNSCYAQLVNNFNTNYYAAELALLSLVLATGNWWRP